MTQVFNQQQLNEVLATHKAEAELKYMATLEDFDLSTPIERDIWDTMPVSEEVQERLTALEIAELGLPF